MKVAAYQAPFLPDSSMEVLGLIRKQTDWCESAGVKILCCPEALLGGLADYAQNPDEVAIDIANGKLEKVLAPLASEKVTTIIGFTEKAAAGRFYNSAAVFHRGLVVGVYRKLHPAIRKSVYERGDQMPVFTLDGLTFGILICNDSNFPDLAKGLAAQGAKAIFIPSNNGLPLEKADVVMDARNVDMAIAKENRVWVIRADVAGHANGRISYGSSAIVNPSGTVFQSAQRLSEDLLVADIDLLRKEERSQ
jgi:predicted amidohydrolase